MHEIILSFKNSLERLGEALDAKYSAMVRDASIKRFEFSVELGWKSVQKFLRSQDVLCNSPKSCLKEAFKFGLVNDDPLWLRMMDDRNLTAHTYNEETAEQIYKNLPLYLPLLKGLLDNIEKSM